MHTRRPRSPRGEGERLREEILVAAEKLLVDTGDPDAVSIRAITEAVGVTAPSVYRHFADKDALLYDVCVNAWVRFDDYVERHSISTDPLEALKQRAMAYVQFGLEHPAHYQVLFMSSVMREKGPEFHVGDPEAETHTPSAEGFWHLVDGIRATIDAGLIADRDPTQLALLLWAAVHGIVSLRLTLPDLGWPPAEKQVDDFFEMAAFGLCPVAGRPGLSG